MNKYDIAASGCKAMGIYLVMSVLSRLPRLSIFDQYGIQLGGSQIYGALMIIILSLLGIYFLFGSGHAARLFIMNESSSEPSDPVMRYKIQRLLYTGIGVLLLNDCLHESILLWQQIQKAGGQSPHPGIPFGYRIYFALVFIKLLIAIALIVGVNGIKYLSMMVGELGLGKKK